MIFDCHFISISVVVCSTLDVFREVLAMARLARAEIFDPNKVAVLHVIARIVSTRSSRMAYVVVV